MWGTNEYRVPQALGYVNRWDFSEVGTEMTIIWGKVLNFNDGSLKLISTTILVVIT